MMPAGVYIGASAAGPVIVGRIEELAKKHGASMAQIGLAWVMAKPGTPPIPNQPHELSAKEPCIF